MAAETVFYCSEPTLLKGALPAKANPKPYEHTDDGLLWVKGVKMDLWAADVRDVTIDPWPSKGDWWCDLCTF